MEGERNIYSDNDMWNRGTEKPVPEPREISNSGEPEKYSCECGNTTQEDFHTDDDKGEVSCNQCGTLILSNMIDPSAPTRRFSSTDPSVDNAHYGAPASNLFAVVDKLLGT